eukprot:scaffold265603_cov27-Prasinocladus_malaysianus.AAC.2
MVKYVATSARVAAASRLSCHRQIYRKNAAWSMALGGTGDVNTDAVHRQTNLTNGQSRRYTNAGLSKDSETARANFADDYLYSYSRVRRAAQQGPEPRRNEYGVVDTSIRTFTVYSYKYISHQRDITMILAHWLSTSTSISHQQQQLLDYKYEYEDDEYEYESSVLS